MSEPTTDPTTAATAAVGDVIDFTYTDALSGLTSQRRGVVETQLDGGHLVVRPLGDYFLQVAPANVITPAPVVPALAPVTPVAAPVYPAPVPAGPAPDPVADPVPAPAAVTYQLPTA